MNFRFAHLKDLYLQFFRNLIIFWYVAMHFAFNAFEIIQNFNLEKTRQEVL